MSNYSDYSNYINYSNKSKYSNNNSNKIALKQYGRVLRALLLCLIHNRQ